jgi:hypothetical protein
VEHSHSLLHFKFRKNLFAISALLLTHIGAVDCAIERVLIEFWSVCVCVNLIHDRSGEGRLTSEMKIGAT